VKREQLIEALGRTKHDCTDPWCLAPMADAVLELYKDHDVLVDATVKWFLSDNKQGGRYPKDTRELIKAVKPFITLTSDKLDALADNFSSEIRFKETLRALADEARELEK